MFIDNMSLKSILVSFEGTLKLEYSDSATIEQLVSDAISKIECTYNVQLDTDVFSKRAENQLLGDTLSPFLRDIQECLKQLTLYTSLCMFSPPVTISLASVNYLGFDREKLQYRLKYLQNKKLYEKRKDIIQQFYTVLNNIPMCQIKRLFVILLLLERLGISEGVSIVTQYIYLGGFNL